MANRRTFFQFVVPSVLAFALSGVYTVIDGLFVGNSLGDIGLTCITLGFPIAAFIQAVGTGIGLSGAIRFTILRGKKAQGEDKKCFSSTVLLLASASIFLTALVLSLRSPLLHLLGAGDSASFDLTSEYVSVIALGAVFQIFATGLVPFIRNLGGSTFAMVSMIAGFLTNIALDYLFVWIYGLGMSGAAIATIIGQAVTMLMAVLFILKKKVGFSIPNLKCTLDYFVGILKVSIAPFGLTFSPHITTILMNHYLMIYGGERSVAVYGCIAYITAIVYLLLQGVGDGSQPLISRYFSEGNVQHMKQMRKLAYLTSAVIAVVCMVVLYFTRSYVSVLFGASSETNGDVSRYLPLFLSTLLFLAYVRITTAFFYATEKSGLSYLLVYAEPILILGLLNVLPRISALGISGIWITVPMAQVITWIIAVVAKHCTNSYERKRTGDN